MKKNEQNIKEYLKYSFDNDLPVKLDWVVGLFAYIKDKEYENDFYLIKDKKFYGKTTDDILLLAEDYTDPILVPTDKISLEKGFLPNIDNNIETTYGRLVINYIIGTYCFHNKIEYINKQFTISDIENDYIKKLLTDDPKDKKGITVDEYKTFIDAALYIESFSKYLSLAATEKSILPPKGIKEFKKKAIEEIKKKYGEDYTKNPMAIAELEKKLLDYDKQYLKDDPSYGKLISGKVAKVARKKLYLDFGIGNSFEEENDGIVESLSDGWDLDPKKLASMANDARKGSYSRGVETQKGGVTAKIALRATSDIKILKKDCGSKVGVDINITEDNYEAYINRYMLDKNNKPILLTEELLKSLIGKTITIRSPLFCHLENDFCTTCTGDNIKDYENGVSLLVSGVGGKILSIALSVFHGKELKVGDIDLSNIQ